MFTNGYFWMTGTKLDVECFKCGEPMIKGKFAFQFCQIKGKPIVCDLCIYKNLTGDDDASYTEEYQAFIDAEKLKTEKKRPWHAALSI
jgi:hypothetical protein